MDFVEVSMVFVHSLFSPVDSSKFEKMTNAERRRWLKRTRDAAECLRDLLCDSPGFSAENVIQAIPPDGMRWFLGCLSVKVTDDESCDLGSVRADGKNWLITDWTLSRAQEGTNPLSLVELLDTLITQIEGGVPSTQTIKKPRDAKAFRASYILRITEGLNAAPFHLTDDQVATVARVMLEDEAITPAIANRFRWRAEKDLDITL